MDNDNNNPLLHVKVPPDLLKSLLVGLIDRKASNGDIAPITAQHYRSSVKHFVIWYTDHFEEFDSTRLLAREWILRARSLSDNECNYAVIGNMIKEISDILNLLLESGRLKKL